MTTSEMISSSSSTNTTLASSEPERRRSKRLIDQADFREMALQCLLGEGLFLERRLVALIRGRSRHRRGLPEPDECIADDILLRLLAGLDGVFDKIREVLRKLNRQLDRNSIRRSEPANFGLQTKLKSNRCPGSLRQVGLK